MQTVQAGCTYKKEFFNGIQFAQFRHTFLFDHAKYPITLKTVKIITKDYDLNLIWSIDCCYLYDDWTRGLRGCYLDKMKVQNFCEYKIKADFMIIGAAGHYGVGEINSFLTTEFKFPKKDFTPSRDHITININVNYDDGRVSSIINDYVKFFKNKQKNDITFIVGDKKIQANKLILSARSDVFATMFNAEMLEKKTGQVPIEDIEPAVFQLLIDFIYYGILESNDPIELLELIMAADKYEIKNLVKVCDSQIANKLSVDTAVDTLIVADLLKLDNLKKQSMNFIARNKTKVTATQAYKKLKEKKHKELSYELFEYVMEQV